MDDTDEGTVPATGWHPNCIVNRGHEITSANWTSFLYELEAVLAELIIHRGAFIVLNVEGPEDLFVQLQVGQDGSIRADASSTMHRACNCPAPRHLVPPEWQAKLLQLGWRPYVIDWEDDKAGPSHRPNYQRDSQPDWLWVAAMFSELMARTLVEVFEVATPTGVRMRFGSFRGEKAEVA